ncbi:unnamed protein product [Sphagnum jensenii]|uniref:Uncharacterized protein n=1 Tax=Sphagnum jensenii TaxID=128206 RepID=A0ABP0WTN2_9BRYO
MSLWDVPDQDLDLPSIQILASPIEFQLPMGMGEVWGCPSLAWRTLRKHHDNYKEDEIGNETMGMVARDNNKHTLGTMRQDKGDKSDMASANGALVCTKKC